MWIVPSDDAEPVGPPPGEPRPGAERTALTALPQRRRPEPRDAASTARIEVAGQLAGERPHRYLIGSSEPNPTPGADEVGATGPHGTGRHPLMRAESGNTEPLIIRPPAQRPGPDPHPADRTSPSGGMGIFAADAGDRAGPAGQLPGGPGPGDLGLRPESVARLSESGRELLARLQAELQGGGTVLGPRPGGLGPDGGGNGTGPHTRVDPPDMAG